MARAHSELLNKHCTTSKRGRSSGWALQQKKMLRDHRSTSWEFECSESSIRKWMTPFPFSASHVRIKNTTKSRLIGKYECRLGTVGHLRAQECMIGPTTTQIFKTAIQSRVIGRQMSFDSRANSQPNNVSSLRDNNDAPPGLHSAAIFILTSYHSTSTTKRLVPDKNEGRKCVTKLPCQPQTSSMR